MTTMDSGDGDAWQYTDDKDENIDYSNFIDLTQATTSTEPVFTQSQHLSLLKQQTEQYKQLLTNLIQQYVKQKLQAVQYEQTHNFTRLKQLLHNTVRAYHSVEGAIYDDFKLLHTKQLQYNKLVKQGEELQAERDRLHARLEAKRAKQRKTDVEAIAELGSITALAGVDLHAITPAQVRAAKFQYEQQLQQVDFYTEQIQKCTDQSNTLLKANGKQLKVEQDMYSQHSAQLQGLLTVDKASRHTREHKLQQLVDTLNGLKQQKKQLLSECDAQDKVAQDIKDQIEAFDVSIEQCSGMRTAAVASHTAVCDKVRQQWSEIHEPCANAADEVSQAFSRLCYVYDTVLQSVSDSNGDNVLVCMFAERYAMSQSQVNELHQCCQSLATSIRDKKGL